MRPRVLLYLYRTRLRVHLVQELLAVLGVAIAVALVFATLLASGSVANSAGKVVRAVVGPADLQVRARGPDGLDEGLLGRVEGLAGVKQAAPLLEQSVTLVSRAGGRATVDLAGTNISLATLNGLAHTLPIAALSPAGIGLSRATAKRLGITGSGQSVLLKVRGRASRLNVTAVLGTETFGALAQAPVAVMPLKHLQKLAGLQGRISRILVETEPGRRELVRNELTSLTDGRLSVTAATEDVSLLHQALGPSNQASALFAAISALLGFLLAFNAMLLTVPERRQSIAGLRVDGTQRTAIVQMVLFQALCLGVVASLLGLLAGYGLSIEIFGSSPGYLSHAFTLGTNTVIGWQPVLLSLTAGVLATCLASLIPLLDLRRDRAWDAVDFESGVAGHALGERIQRHLFALAAGLLLSASVLFVLVPAAALIACVLLALTTVLAAPLMLAGGLRAAGGLAARSRRLGTLAVAVMSLKATTMRSLALTATGAVALFGSIALGGARGDLSRGIAGYTSHYVGSADLWVVNPEDNQAIDDFTVSARAAHLTEVPGVAAVHSFQGSFLDFGRRRIWMIAWPAAVPLGLLDKQIVSGDARLAATRVRAGGWITLSHQIALEHHVHVGSTLVLPTPTGGLPLRVAATTTNFGWSPGAIVLSTSDYSHGWGSTSPSALGVTLRPGAQPAGVRDAIERQLGPNSGLEVLTAVAREEHIDASASEGLRQLGEISTLLVIAATMAMLAALGSSIWQRRASLAGLRIEGTRPSRLRRIIFVEVAVMLVMGCFTGALAGIYGQLVIDDYLRNVTGFPVASSGIAIRPLELSTLVVITVLALATLPSWLASRVPSRLALDE